VRGVVAGLDGESFEDAAGAAASLCPVANALHGNVRIGITGELAEALPE
jgi:organic hydroperoxide reductase OsmC/OhrA